MKLELAGLKPLQVAKVSLPQNKHGEGLATLTLYRKSTQLLETLYQMSTNAKVVDTKQTKSGEPSGDAVRPSPRAVNAAGAILALGGAAAPCGAPARPSALPAGRWDGSRCRAAPRAALPCWGRCSAGDGTAPERRCSLLQLSLPRSPTAPSLPSECRAW